MNEIMITARRAAQSAGEILQGFYRDGFSVRLKAAADLVTDADVAAEKRIAEVILSDFPEHCILGEEEHTSDIDVEHLWVVDPLDGTTNFAHGISHFAVSIAYYHHGVPTCGVIWNPIRDDWYTAERGGGAFHNNSRIHVGTQQSMAEVLIGVGFYYDRGAKMEATLAAIRDCFHSQIRGIRRFGTASLDLAHVASGFYGGYFEYDLNPWDFAAGRLLVEEAGGQVIACNGTPLPLSRSTVLATSPGIHESLLQITARHMTSF
jgi:myo-inositol-1(or 4)-monophosphatase